MTDANSEHLQQLLRLIAASTPEPWYPMIHAREANVPRESLDPPLDHLRLGGVICLTDWVAGRGQGYRLTAAGEKLLANPRQLAGWLRGDMAVEAEPHAPEHFAGTAWDRGEDVRAIFLKPAYPIVTYGLIWLMIGVFVIGLLSAQSVNIPLNDYLASGRSPVEAAMMINGATWLRGEWWRLLTYAFVHGGLLHIGFNLYGLYNIGPLTEQMWGRGRYLVIYLMAALGGGCAVLITGPLRSCVGASGALCGVLAALSAWVYLNRNYLPKRLLQDWRGSLTSSVIMIVLISMVPGVSAAGHAGGALVGLIAAVLLHFHRYATGWVATSSLLGLLLLPVACVAVVRQAQAHDADWLHLMLDHQARQRRGEIAAERLQPANVDGDRIELESQVLPQALKAERMAMQLFEQSAATALIARPAAERPAADIAKAEKMVARAIGLLAEGAALLRHSGPYTDAPVEAARVRCLALMLARLKVYESTVRCLVAGDNWTKDDQKGLDEQQQSLQEANQRFRALLD
jgi:membrane associated rhomboid family serine protease